MKILHLAIDEKFIPFIQTSFESVYPSGNRFAILNTKKEGKWKYVYSNEGTVVGNTAYFFGGGLKKDLEWCDVLIIHFMTPWFAYAATLARADLPIIWAGWGADYYYLIPGFSDEELVLPKSKVLLSKADKIGRLSEGSQSIMKSIKDYIINGVFIRNAMDKVLTRVDFFSSPIEADYELLNRALPGFTAEFFQIHYGSAESNIINKEKINTRVDILVGNSATATNNHIEAFELLSGVDIGDRKIVVPLSYGNDGYKNEVIKRGVALFGDNFLSLVKFIPLEEYNEIIGGCSIVIMNHCRQQALGNIITCMLSGAKVFLRENNPLFSFFKENGVHVFSIKSLEENKIDLFSPLTKEEIIENKDFIMSNWGASAVFDSIRRLTMFTNIK